ncbi:MAG: PD40 domain-containing protein [Planctomycetes bacterium]|nr:PD40 domain-containing protein [Planctomycetota bacterium]
MSADGMTLVFTSDRPGGQGGFDLWTCKRLAPSDAAVLPSE